ncbi:MAG TPA: amino acid--tRNA ligase-related protein [Candidatus Saccharimonadales bacterium]|nr:amino acid--tRNA ligase-related protein [Candidatus Saccharimonadales bacterium]
MLSDHISPSDYHKLSKKLREFFEKKGLVECYLQNRLSILAACEDPSNISTFQYVGQIWPQIQTNQMHLERVILTEPDPQPGYFVTTTSYREEQNPIPNRHCLIFGMTEWELPCDFEKLIQFEKELLEHLGFGETSTYVEVNYVDMCEKYGVQEITHVEEQRLYEDYGPVVFLKHFPHPYSFWNMKREGEIACKVDVILTGFETIGSAQRSCDPEEMRQSFRTISDGQYAQLLYDQFGHERVDKELEDYLSLKFTTRSGAGMGQNRMITAMKKLNLL